MRSADILGSITGRQPHRPALQNFDLVRCVKPRPTRADAIRVQIDFAAIELRVVQQLAARGQLLMVIHDDCVTGPQEVP